MEFYKLTKDLFTKEEFNDYHHIYNGYDILINYDEKLKRWECDVFDLEAEQYVLYPCVKVKDPSSSQFDTIAQFVGHLIEEKIKNQIAIAAATAFTLFSFVSSICFM